MELLGLRVFFVALAVSSGLTLQQELENEYEVNRNPEGYTLQHVNLFQRHSIRAPAHINPRWTNASDYPLGLGNLTAIGRQKSIEMGKILRTFYGLFLGDDPHTVWAQSSTCARSYETLALELEALYPPKGSWNVGHPVQPIPITMLPNGHDVACDPKPIFLNFEHLFNVTDPALIKDGFENLGEFIKFVTRKGGYPTNNTAFFSPTVYALYTQRCENIPLPQWATRIWSSMDFATRKLSFEYNICRIPRLGDYSGKVIAESLVKAGTQKNGRLKLSIMNYHDSHITAILNALGLDHVKLFPYFLATMHFQLYKKNSDGTFWVRTLYDQGLKLDGSFRKATMLKVPGCTFPNCPLSTFAKIMSNLYPNLDPVQCGLINREALL